MQHSKNHNKPPPSTTIPGECPYPDELGRAGWTILHTAAAVYPNHPTKEQQEGFRKFIEGWAWSYACSHCAYHMRQSLIRHPPVVTNKREASTYICTLHNKVNALLGKEEYDCSPEVVLKRWHPTYPEMDDTPLIEDQVAALRKAEAAAKQAAQTATANPTTGGVGSGGWFGWMTGGASNTSSTPQEPTAASRGPVTAGGSRWSASEGLQSDSATTAPKGAGTFKSGWSGSGSSPPTSSSPSGGPGASEEDLAAIMAKVKACAVYCPDEEKKRKLEGYGL